MLIPQKPVVLSDKFALRHTSKNATDSRNYHITYDTGSLSPRGNTGS